jgi:hypothetical protein
MFSTDSTKKKSRPLVRAHPDPARGPAGEVFVNNPG